MRDNKAKRGHVYSPIASRWLSVAIPLAIADIGILAFSMVVSFRLRFDGLSWGAIYEGYIRHHLHSLPIGIALYLGCFWAFRLYRSAWRYAGLEMLWGVFYSNTLAITCLVIVQRIMDGGIFPRSVLAMLWLAGIISVGGIRVLLRMFSTSHQRRSIQNGHKNNSSLKRVIILGGAANGVQVLRAVQEDPVLGYHVIGFLDDDPNKWGVYVSNVKILGPLSLLKRLLAERAVDEVIVAISDTGSSRIREHVMLCRKYRLPVKVIPELRDVVAGRAAAELTDFSVEDLLRRPPASVDIARIGRYLSGKRVLVTGAGGSIGSELCRQIASLNPSSLILVGHGENSIHQIHQELQTAYPNMTDRIHYAIASVSQPARVHQVIEGYRPQIVFHAAAHKHVPMMEINEQEAVQNNVLGTLYVSDECGRLGVEQFVLISTDKAADPCSIMGATKWLCEEIMRVHAVLWPGTSYIAVRFGNVLGSRGSVIPTFCDQIKRGGPITVTHPDMTRFFMTIPEAVRLVIHAGGTGETGQLYLLDMGEPVKVLDIAVDTILMHGLEPGVDIPIHFMGVRPGEKLHERLTSEAEKIERTPWEGLLVVRRPTYYNADELLSTVALFEHAVNHASGAEVRRLLNQAVRGVCELQTPIYDRQAA